MGRDSVPDAKPGKRQASQKRDRPTQSGQGASSQAALTWADEAWQDYLWFAHDKPALHARINRLIEQLQKNPFAGKPEPLKYEFAGYWSRRINQEHRLVQQVRVNEIRIAQCRYHYKKK